MKQVIMLAIAAFALGGCLPGASLVINAEDIYHGYPCFDHCAEFQEGYQSAEIASLRNTNQCASGSDAYMNGCKSYINEYRIEQIENGGLYLKN